MANRASNPSEGFLGPRERCFTVPPRSPEEQGVICRRFSPHLASDQGISPSAPLDGRAWAFQERLSARRIDHFYQNEMIWECESAVLCECGKLTGVDQGLEGNQRLENDSSPLKLTMSYASIERTTERQWFQKWTMLVERFAGCSRTWDEDRLPALGGLARLLGGAAFGCIAQACGMRSSCEFPVEGEGPFGHATAALLNRSLVVLGFPGRTCGL